MSMLVYHNGLFFPEDEVQLSCRDRSYLYGEGLFETMRAQEGRIPLLREHLSRLKESCTALDFKPPWLEEEIAFAAEQTLRKNQIEQGYVRLQLSREQKVFGQPGASSNYHFLIIAVPWMPPQKAFTEQGISAVLYPHVALALSPWSRFKLTDYFLYLKIKEYAQAQGVEEALIKNIQGFLVEASSYNLWIYKEAAWHTPALSEACLDGVARRVLLKLMRGKNIIIHEGQISEADLRNADEAFLSNALRGLVPLVSYEGRPIGQGKVGSKTQQLWQEWQCFFK